MKNLVLIFVLSLIPFASFAESKYLSLDGMTELAGDEYKAVSAAVLVANNNSSTYGLCNLGFFGGRGTRLFVDYNSVNPLIVSINDQNGEYLKLNSDSAMAMIISIEYGNFVWGKGNRGTLVKPEIYDVRVITSSGDCMEKK